MFYYTSTKMFHIHNNKNLFKKNSVNSVKNVLLFPSNKN